MKKILYIVLGIIIFFIIILIFSLFYFTSLDTSQESVVKYIHANTVKYISEEIQKCKLGDKKFMVTLDCPATADKAIYGAVETGENINPYDLRHKAVRISRSSTNDEDVGYISLSTSGSNIIIKTCHRKPCSNENNRRSDIIEIK